MKIGKCRSLILFLSTVFIYPVLAEKDCNDIPIFKRHLELTACDLEKRIDDELQELTDVKIISFTPSPIENSISYINYIFNYANNKRGVLRFSGNHKGKEVKLRCEPLHAWDDAKERNYFHISIQNCENRNFEIKKTLIFRYSTDIIKENWKRRMRPKSNRKTEIK